MNLPRINKLIAYRAVFWEMALKQLKTKYSGSFLGIWWAVILPLVLAASINFVFSKVFGAGPRHFALFLLSGLLPWIFFANASTEAAGSFIRHGSELRQNIFPRELVPLSGVLADFLNFSIGLALLLPVFCFFKPSVIILLPFLFLVLFFYLLFVSGVGLLFAGWNVFFRDLTHILSVGMMVWFWVTPVFYSVDTSVAAGQGLFLLNPVTPFIVVFQKLLFQAYAPSLGDLGLCVAVAVLFFAAGYGSFLKKEAELLKRI